MDPGLSAIIYASIMIGFLTLTETFSPGYLEIIGDLQSFTPPFLRRSHKSLEEAKVFHDFYIRRIAPVLKTAAYCLLGYGLIEYTCSLVTIIQYRNALIALNCAVLALMFLLDCVVSAKRLNKTRLFSKWNERGVFLFKKFIPLLLLIVYAVALPQFCYSLPMA